ncbi:hypothetical protein [Vogesella sp. AC12]|uniref:hypothetical protein n=1 Tax=Vogesella sp. AC12 TaxID=2950550 RepID=UPI00210E580F|nr:hypothetical protein [Vogesella sp. AC12]MCQ4143190.1 hypothetical protein [Vogesella sp. AC12]
MTTMHADLASKVMQLAVSDLGLDFLLRADENILSDLDALKWTVEKQHSDRQIRRQAFAAAIPSAIATACLKSAEQSGLAYITESTAKPGYHYPKILTASFVITTRNKNSTSFVNADYSKTLGKQNGRLEPYNLDLFEVVDRSSLPLDKLFAVISAKADYLSIENSVVTVDIPFPSLKNCFAEYRLSELLQLAKEPPVPPAPIDPAPILLKRLGQIELENATN